MLSHLRNVYGLIAIVITAFSCSQVPMAAAMQMLQQNLWLECACQHISERNASNWGQVALNAATIRLAKNNCFLIFITAATDEIVALRLTQWQLSANCLDYIEVFPYLRESVIENTTMPEYIICNHTTTNTNTNLTAGDIALNQWQNNQFIYSGGRLLGLRVRFRKPITKVEQNAWTINVTGEYKFLKKDNFKNDGRLIPGTYCDYYFFADPNQTSKSMEIWQYFHSPRFPAKYPAHIKCSYKFIGRQGSLVEIIFEELHVPKQEQSCSLDKLTIFDSESVNMNTVIDVLCDALPTRRLISSGPDLLIEFNASSNITAKGFRGKFKFIIDATKKENVTLNATHTTPTAVITTEAVVAMEKIDIKEKSSITPSKLTKLNSTQKYIGNIRDFCKCSINPKSS